MKIKRALFCATLTLLSQMSFADTNPSTPSPTVSNSTSSFAKSTVSVAQDTAITTYIYAKMATHPDLANSNIDISTQEGKVIINGIVNNTSQAKEISQLAQSTAGVQGVDSSKLIIGQQTDSLYIKTAATSAVPQIDPSTNTSVATTTPNPEHPNLSDPLLTADAGTQANNPQQKPVAAMPLEASVETKAKPVKTVKLATNHSSLKKISKHRLAALHKSKLKRLSQHHHHKTAKLAAKHSHKKILAHHRLNKRITKALAQHHKKHPSKSLASQKKITKTQLASRTPVSKNPASKESVDQMTNDYLKQALTANQPIPEE